MSDDQDDRMAMATLGAYIAQFRRQSTQMNSHRIGGAWWRLRVPAQDAAAWANLGFLPEEAADLIRDGITPQTYREIEDHAEERAGGADALATQRVADLIADGLTGPDGIVAVPDPDDPQRQIIALQEDTDGH